MSYAPFSLGKDSSTHAPLHSPLVDGQVGLAHRYRSPALTLPCMLTPSINAPSCHVLVASAGTHNWPPRLPTAVIPPGKA
ncbi:hypothetical protein HZ326_12093, partial [Fusarium oxysporum f. sp. albedinis]